MRQPGTDDREGQRLDCDREQSLSGIEGRQIEVAKSTDTTEISALKRYFIRYLTHKQIQNVQLTYLVQLGQVYHKEGFYYFTTDGFKDYLRIQKYVIGRLNLREELLRYGCAEGEVKYRVSAGEKVIACWKKTEDEELLNMGVFYDDMKDSDASAIEATKVQKIDDSFDKNEEAPDGKYKF